MKKKLKIIQITGIQWTTVGLGNDGLLYKWNVNKAVWILHKKEKKVEVPSTVLEEPKA